MTDPIRDRTAQLLCDVAALSASVEAGQWHEVEALCDHLTTHQSIDGYLNYLRHVARSRQAPNTDTAA